MPGGQTVPGAPPTAGEGEPDVEILSEWSVPRGMWMEVDIGREKPMKVWMPEEAMRYADEPPPAASEPRRELSDEEDVDLLRENFKTDRSRGSNMTDEELFGIQPGEKPERRD